MSSLPSYLAAAKPVPAANRAAWYKNIAPTYLGVMFWFVFWASIVNGGDEHVGPGGILSMGVGTAFLGLVIAALICHFLFYLVPGLLGQQTGLPLYVVGTSTYGAAGGLIMPGFLMGLLQFGWLGVNAFAVSKLLCECFGWMSPLAKFQPCVPHAAIVAVFVFVTAFVGLKGIQYVAKVATLLPLIPLVVLILLFVKTAGGLGDFDPKRMALENAPAAGAAEADAAKAAKADAPAPVAAKPAVPLDTWGVLALLSTYIVGFFATAGAAGTDVAANSRSKRDVQLGGLTGIALATIFSGGMTILIVAGAYGAHMVPNAMSGVVDPLKLMNGNEQILNKNVANWVMILLAISSIPGGCFSAFIAANSFKTTMPKVNPFISVGLGALASLALAASGLAGEVSKVFVVIGASFGPVCGAMAADYLLAGRKWAGPRAGFNPAGWISWIVGFAVGAFNLVAPLLTPWIPALAGKETLVPVPPVAAFVVGFVLYAILAMIGLQSRSLEMPKAK